MGLASAEVGLQLDHRVAACPGQPFGGSRQQITQTLGDVGAGEELTRILIFGFGAAVGDLPQIGRVLGLHEVPAGHIFVRCDDVAPRCQRRLGGALGRLGRGAAALATGFLVEHSAHQTVTQLVDLGALASVAEHLQQSFHRVEAA